MFILFVLDFVPSDEYMCVFWCRTKKNNHGHLKFICVIYMFILLLNVFMFIFYI